MATTKNSRKAMIQEPDQKKINKMIYDIFWELGHSLEKGEWLKGRLETFLPQLEEAITPKHTCEACGAKKEKK